MQRQSPFFIIITAGLIIALNWHAEFINYVQNWLHPKPQKLWFCPAPDQVSANQSNPDAFSINGVNWVVDYHGWSAPEKIGFMHALITEAGNVSCYYQWNDPKNPGTNLWMTVKLSPLINQKIRSYGAYWQQDNRSAKICSVGINACAFEVLLN